MLVRVLIGCPEPLTRDRPRPRVASGVSDPFQGWGGWVLLAMSVSAYAAVSIAMGQPFHAGGLRLRSFDLRIYRLAARALLHGSSLYARPMLHGLGFTYPPFAAVLMAPLGWASLRVDELIVTALNLLLLIFVLRRTLMLPSRGHAAEPRPAPPWSLAAGLAAAALWLEPVSVTLGYGQINLLIVALVVFDLSRPDRARAKGAAIGLAAAIKLTPLLFIAYLLGSGRVRAAGVAALSFLASVALSFAILTRVASAYWFHAVFDISRVGSALFPGNQSLHGMAARFTGSSTLTGGAELLIVAVTLCGTALAVRASRRGDEAAGFSLAALSALLASPISWSHHWTLAVPALVLLARRAHEQRSGALAAAAGLLGLVGYAYLPELAESRFASARGLGSLPSTDPYPLVALLALAVCVASFARARLRGLGWSDRVGAAVPRPVPSMSRRSLSRELG